MSSFSDLDKVTLPQTVNQEQLDEIGTEASKLYQGAAGDSFVYFDRATSFFILTSYSNTELTCELHRSKSIDEQKLLRAELYYRESDSPKYQPRGESDSPKYRPRGDSSTTSSDSSLCFSLKGTLGYMTRKPKAMRTTPHKLLGTTIQIKGNPSVVETTKKPPGSTIAIPHPGSLLDVSSPLPQGDAIVPNSVAKLPNRPNSVLAAACVGETSPGVAVMYSAATSEFAGPESAAASQPAKKKKRKVNTAIDRIHLRPRSGPQKCCLPRDYDYLDGRRFDQKALKDFQKKQKYLKDLQKKQEQVRKTGVPENSNLNAVEADQPWDPAEEQDRLMYRQLRKQHDDIEKNGHRLRTDEDSY